MFACLFFGDSLALGAGTAVNALLARSCEVRAAEGASSSAMLRWPPQRRMYDTTILSIGSNDDVGPTVSAGQSGRALARITALRGSAGGRRVIWLLPYERRRAALVRRVAVTFDDEVLDLARFATRDRIHPADYRSLAAALLRGR